MLKETETEETIGFCHIFIIGGISTGPLHPPFLATPMLYRNLRLLILLVLSIVVLFNDGC